jgi:hypothetical protein
MEVGVSYPYITKAEPALWSASAVPASISTFARGDMAVSGFSRSCSTPSHSCLTKHHLFKHLCTCKVDIPVDHTRGGTLCTNWGTQYNHNFFDIT